MFSPDPYISSFEDMENLLLERPDYSIVLFVYLLVSKELVFSPLLYAKFFELGEKSLSITDPRLPATKLICSNSHPVGKAALSAWMMFLCCSFASASFVSKKPSSLPVDHLNSNMKTLCFALSITTPSGRLFQKHSAKKRPGS